jgi:hypothetical protein
VGGIGKNAPHRTSSPASAGAVANPSPAVTRVNVPEDRRTSVVAIIVIVVIKESVVV